MTTEEMLERCRKFVENKPYYWFRLSYSTINYLLPQWVCWIETLSGTIAQTYHPQLYDCLKLMINYIDEVEEALAKCRKT